VTVLNEADAVYLGGQAVDAVYAGANKVWPAAPPVLTYPETVLAKNPQGYWRLGQATGAVPDLTGNNRPMTVSGAAATAASLLPNGDGASTALSGGAIVTANLVGQFFSFSNSLTYEVWMRPTSFPGNSAQIGALVNSGLFVVLISTGQIVLAQGWAGTPTKVASASNIQINTAYHIVVTSTDDNISNLYLNGADATGIVTPRTVTSASGRITISTGGQTALAAQLQEIAYYDRPLSLTEAQENYAAGGGT